MSGTDFHRISFGGGELASFTPYTPKETVAEKSSCSKKLHRIATVRRSQGISLLNCARRLGITLQEARYQEQPTTDLTLSQLNAWKDALDVPLSELLGESSDFLEDPIRNRAMMVKVMKTAKQILQTAHESRIRFMGQTLVDQLVELMPELTHISAWPDVGQSHENREPGVAATRRFDAEVARRFDV